jgi:hypothetical protein
MITTTTYISTPLNLALNLNRYHGDVAEVLLEHGADSSISTEVRWGVFDDHHCTAESLLGIK